ncbi:hypothetical protein HELRODRAFT_126005, partial [Helobdella robusta]|uniref:RRM domain-containing protein n=1 Tax=Helobdella robusta TaxID=6412 RepID=T1EH82_HELRO
SSKSRSASPVKRKNFSVSASRSKTPRRQKHSKKSSPTRSRSRSYGKHSRFRSRTRRESYDARRLHSRKRYNKKSPNGSPPSKRRRMGDRENPKECKCLGIFGMSFYTNEQTLRDVFKKYGPIDRIQIIYDHYNSRSRGFAFVSFKHIDDAVNAKKDASDMEIDGRRVRVDYSITERAHTPTPGTYM